MKPTRRRITAVLLTLTAVVVVGVGLWWTAMPTRTSQQFYNLIASERFLEANDLLANAEFTVHPNGLVRLDCYRSGVSEKITVGPRELFRLKPSSLHAADLLTGRRILKWKGRARYFVALRGRVWARECKRVGDNRWDTLFVPEDYGMPEFHFPDGGFSRGWTIPY